MIRATFSLGATLFAIVSLIDLDASNAEDVVLESVSKPNVVLIYTDDHRYSGVHSLGGMQVQTPHIDQLKDNGLAFTNAYLMGAFSGATCIPSRSSLLTGRQLFDLEGVGRRIPETHTTIGETFQNAGYNTHIVGKWHQDHDSLSRSFDSGSTIMGVGLYLVDHYRMPLWDWPADGRFDKENAYLLQYDEEGNVSRRAIASDDVRGPIGSERNGPHTSEVFADNAVQFIENYKSEDPFFMYLAFHAPHDPRQAPQKYKDLYPESEIDLPPSVMSEHPFDNGHMFLRDEELAPWPRTDEVVREHLSDYYAIITHLDEQIGRVVESLRASGNYENTLIVFAGDSGLAVGNHGLIGKQNVYDEDGLHVPFIISGNLVKEHGREIESLCYIHDIFPTICDLTTVSKPDSITGKSLKPVIDREIESAYDYTYHAYLQYQRAYRKGDYKLIEYVRGPGEDWKLGYGVRGSRVTQLFNYKEDPWETRNLAFFPQFRERIEAMREEMKAAARTLGDHPEHFDYEYNFWDYFDE